jgi:hypothetical protein
MTPDDHRLTTYGSVLINRALQTSQPGERDFLELYRLARKQFEDAHKYRPENPVPIDLFLSYLMRIAVGAREHQANIPPEVLRDWSQWEEHARGMSAFTFGPVATAFAERKAVWLNTVLFTASPEG